MKQSEYQQIENWFCEYIKKMNHSYPRYAEAFTIKEEHTFRVVNVVLMLAEQLQLNASERLLIQSLTLLHDAGRFSQFAEFQTFADSRSVDHGARGVQLIIKEAVADKLKPEEKTVILKGVAHHNALVLPDSLTDREFFFLKMLRDADKLDVLRLAADFYHTPKEKRHESIALELPETDIISPDIMKDIHSRKLVNKDHLKSLHDFKILQLSWIFDINFDWTKQKIYAEELHRKIWETLPELPEKRTIYDVFIKS